MTIDLDYYERQMTQWEVSSFDIAQNKTYTTWAEKNVKGMNTDAIESMINDVNNMHFAFVRPPRKIIDKVLHELGLDIEQSVERQVCLHKTFAGHMVNGERFVGSQRSDKDWLNFIKRVIA